MITEPTINHDGPTREELIELLRVATAEGQPELSDVQRAWLQQAEAGTLR